MKLVNEPPRDFVNCEVCGELIGEHAPAIEVSYGFCGDDGHFWVEESVVVHHTCVDRDIVQIVLQRMESN